MTQVAEKSADKNKNKFLKLFVRKKNKEKKPKNFWNWIKSHWLEILIVGLIMVITITLVFLESFHDWWFKWVSTITSAISITITLLIAIFTNKIRNKEKMELEAKAKAEKIKEIAIDTVEETTELLDEKLDEFINKSSSIPKKIINSSNFKNTQKYISDVIRNDEDEVEK